MSRYLASRAVQTVVTLVLMSLVVYLLIGLMPGDPIDLMITGDPKMTSEDAARLRSLYGLDKPLLDRYLAWAGQALQGIPADRIERVEVITNPSAEFQSEGSGVINLVMKKARGAGQTGSARPSRVRATAA